jgi:hypothetical protein
MGAINDKDITVLKQIRLKRIKQRGAKSKQLPVSVTVDAHGVVAVGKDHLSAGLQANAALILSLGVLVIGVKLPATAVAVALAPPFPLALFLHHVLLNLLQERVYYSCIPLIAAQSV